MNNEKILNGKALSEQILHQIRQQVLPMKNTPNLAAILIGDDPSSHLYVKLKKRACDFCQINFHQYFFSKKTPVTEIFQVIDFLNKDKETDGILVQLPLPTEFPTNEIINRILPQKDIDGFHEQNLQKNKNNETKIYSPLILGVMELLRSTGENLTNKKITILCNHKIFGRPFLELFDESNEISIKTLQDNDYQEKLKSADVLIVSIGQPQFIRAEQIKKNAIIIDIGINKINGQIVGDVDFYQVLPKVKFISPVPGGVGPMTIAMLLQNLLKIHKNK
ncbi:MAG: bifunctional 5,10-methylenetetrahydrofolate dehydrogenase/5,10-methenyltetrahydrofolate cyclohydrolase [Patescibacteria group bacterium]